MHVIGRCNPSVSCAAVVHAGGDGSHHASEQCDDMNYASGDGCSASCTIEQGWECGNGTLLSPDVCVTQCGNGVPTVGEECDDGNVLGGDGCGASCVVEQGWLCTVVQPVVQEEATNESAGEFSFGPFNLGPSECRREVGQPVISPRAGPIFVEGPAYVEGKELSDAEKLGIQQLFVNITMAVQPAAAVILYTLNGTDPRIFGDPYEGRPVVLKGGTTRIRAVATRVVDWPFWSPVAEATRVIGPEADGDFVVSICQDGIRTSAEECDDGVGGGSGCSMECTIENGWVCPEEMAVAAAISETPTHVLREITDRCYDCDAAKRAAEIEAAAAGLPLPPSDEFNCPSGLYMGVECGTCQSCPEGFYCQGGPDNERRPCAAGTWVDYINAFECESCPAHSTSRRGAVSIDLCQCSPGFTGEAASAAGCRQCVDSYKPTAGPDPCTPCPANTVTSGEAPAERRADCKCLPGYHNPIITAWYAALPAPDAASDREQAVLQEMPEPAEVECVKCAGGHFCIGGDEPQRPCRRNMWSPEGSTACEWCPANAEQPVDTLISSPDQCVCSAGYYSMQENMSPPCASCPPGLFKEEAGSLPMTACRTCPPGSYSSALNATAALTCTPCSAPGAPRALTSPQGSTEASDCVSGVWLAVANMQASKDRPTRVHRYSFEGQGGLVTTPRAPPQMPAEYDSDALGRKVGVLRVTWIQSLDWLTAMPLGGLRNPDALLLVSTLDELELLQLDLATHTLVSQQRLIAPTIGHEVVRFHNNNPTFVLTVHPDKLSGKIYELTPPDAGRGTKPRLKILCTTGGISKCGINFPGPSRSVS